MRLTRLELAGFKSFADTIELPYEEGITCIVGPNGCGKSNISDAVRWVLGEQRARMLRGAKMDEVIFQGSAKRKPLNLAEVSLYFDNTDGTLPIAYQEVVVTRRLSRSGQSDYLINQTPTRLKDVQDLLRGTGLGSDAGVVIEARMIDRLLSDRADERRSLFEEAAGIGLYRDRKTVTERRLDKTLEDMQRLDDLISEVQTQVRSLARQRGKAERHERFTAERFQLVMELARRDLARFDERVLGIAEQRTDVDARLPRMREALAQKERDRGSRVQDRATAEAQRTAAERRLSERRLDFGRLEGELNLARERLQSASTRRQRAQEEREQAERRAAQAQFELDAAGEEREAARTARHSVQIELDLRAATEDETRERLVTQRGRVRDLEEALQRHGEAARSLAGEQQALERETEDLRAQEVEVTERARHAQRRVEELRSQLAEAQRALEAAAAEDQRATHALDTARHRVAAAREHEAETALRRRGADERVTQLRARREVLESLERDREGLAPAVKRLLDVCDTWEPDTVLGPLSDFVSPRAETARLAEQLLGEWLHAVLVRDDAAIDAVKAWHRDTQPGPILLLPVTPGPAGDNPDPGMDLDLDVADAARGWIHALLAGHRRIDEHGTGIRRANGAVYLPGQDDGGGPLARRAELDQIRADAEAAIHELETVERQTQDAANAFRTAEQQLTEIGEAAESARHAFQERRSEAEEAGREMQRAERDQGEADEVRQRIAERIADREHRVETLRTDRTGHEEARGQVAIDLHQERQRLANFEAEQEAARERRVHWQVEEAQVTARETAAGERETRAHTALTEATAEMGRLDEELHEIRQTTEELDRQIADGSDTLSERRVEIHELETAAADAERAVGRAEEALRAAEEEMQKARNTVQALSDRYHQLELEHTEVGGRRQALIERIEGEWNKPLDHLLAKAEPLEGESETLREEATRLKDAIDAMGPVNPLAAQEYEEEKNRLDFLQTQREDLMDARTSLLHSLREIDQTARQMFVETFEAIREHYQRVFQTLFEGGECDLSLADSSDPLTSEIEIRAAPRGKRTQRIHLLSSGERALVAISLLFAIYLAKPSPFCLLDEVDAPLDDANVQRFIRLLTEFKADTQFIVITHNPRTMQVADAVYGVTMQEPGVSTIVGVRLGEHAGV
jgi:chromosome segregation protein